MASENTNKFSYNGEQFQANVPKDFISNNLETILSKNNIEKYFNKDDFTKLRKFLPEGITNEKEFIINNISNLNSINPIKVFSNMIENNYFSKNYQKNLERYKIDALESLTKIYKEKYTFLKEKYILLKGLSKEYSEEENIQSIFTFDNIKVRNLKDAESSGYTTFSSEDEPVEDKKNQYEKESINKDDNIKESEIIIEGATLSDERFKNFKMSKNQLTIRIRSKQEIENFQKQEVERYSSPHLPYTYYNHEGFSCIVAPVVKKQISKSASKPRDHAMLKSDRPAFITILCLVRDAASRLPEGVGTRADICDLLKDSQYISEKMTDSMLNSVVSGALDRLHYEKDPCVKYDLQKKLWIYLHKNRSADFPAWNYNLRRGDDEEKQSELDLVDDSYIIESSKEADSSAKKSRKSDTLLKQKRKNI